MPLLAVNDLHTFFKTREGEVRAVDGVSFVLEMSDLAALIGPNGAGKSTAAPALLQGALAVSEFVNADVIARGLSEFDPDSAGFRRGPRDAVPTARPR